MKAWAAQLTFSAYVPLLQVLSVDELLLELEVELSLLLELDELLLTSLELEELEVLEVELAVLLVESLPPPQAAKIRQTIGRAKTLRASSWIDLA
jgi:hypothetical protein